MYRQFKNTCTPHIKEWVRRYSSIIGMLMHMFPVSALFYHRAPRAYLLPLENFCWLLFFACRPDVSWSAAGISSHPGQCFWLNAWTAAFKPYTCWLVTFLFILFSVLVSVIGFVSFSAASWSCQGKAASDFNYWSCPVFYVNSSSMES